MFHVFSGLIGIQVGNDHLKPFKAVTPEVTERHSPSCEEAQALREIYLKIS